MTHDEMKQAIAAGMSVSYGGRIIVRVEDLPTPAELAKGNPTAEAQTAADLDRQIAALQAQRATLTTTEPAKPADLTEAQHAALASEMPNLTVPQIVALTKAGYDSYSKLAAATDEELLAVDGIGKAVLTRIRAGA